MSFKSTLVDIVLFGTCSWRSPMPIAWKALSLVAVIGRADISLYVTNCLRDRWTYDPMTRSHKACFVPLGQILCRHDWYIFLLVTINGRPCLNIGQLTRYFHRSFSCLAASASLPPLAQHSAFVCPFLWRLSHLMTYFLPLVFFSGVSSKGLILSLSARLAVPA